MALNSMDFHAFARAAASGLLNSLIAGMGMAAVAWLVSRTAGRNSARTRFLVWIITFIAMVFLPVVGSVAASSYAVGPTSAASALTLPQSLAFYLVAGWMLGAVLGFSMLDMACIACGGCVPLALKLRPPSLIRP